jgi:hypothetical protein
VKSCEESRIHEILNGSLMKAGRDEHFLSLVSTIVCIRNCNFVSE